MVQCHCSSLCYFCGTWVQSLTWELPCVWARQKKKKTKKNKRHYFSGTFLHKNKIQIAYMNPCSFWLTLCQFVGLLRFLCYSVVFHCFKKIWEIFPSPDCALIHSFSKTFNRCLFCVRHSFLVLDAWDTIGQCSCCYSLKYYIPNDLV